MAPKSHLTVYHVLPNTNEIVADHIELQVENLLSKFIRLSSNFRSKMIIITRFPYSSAKMRHSLVKT